MRLDGQYANERLTGENDPEEVCVCGHAPRYHGKEGCEYERDRWVSGESMGAWVAWKCNCSESE